jgi:hypothetical protein
VLSCDDYPGSAGGHEESSSLWYNSFVAAGKNLFATSFNHNKLNTFFEKEIRDEGYTERRR